MLWCNQTFISDVYSYNNPLSFNDCEEEEIIMRSHLPLKWLKERANNLPLLSIKWVKLNSNLQTLAVFVSDPSPLATLQV